MSDSTGPGAGHRQGAGATMPGTEELGVRSSAGAGHVIRRLFRLRGRLWQQTLPDDTSGAPVHRPGCALLHGPMAQRTLGRHTSLDQSTTAPIVERLPARVLLTATRDNAEARRSLLDLTDAVRQPLTRLAPYAARVEDLLLGGLDPLGREQFFRLAHRVHAAPDSDSG